MEVDGSDESDISRVHHAKVLLGGLHLQFRC